MAARLPVVGLMCGNEVAGRPIQAVASRFVAPLARLSRCTVLLVPAVADANDAGALAGILDGLLLTGARTHVAPSRHSPGHAAPLGPLDEARDEVALGLAARMIEAGRPVFGVCRGMQEINVLFGGTLSHGACGGRHLSGSWDAYPDLFDHRHDVLLTRGGRLHDAAARDRLTVNSVHEQGIDRLGYGLAVEAVAADDGLVEAIAARPCGGDVLAVQWHPEWGADDAADDDFFALFGASLRGGDRDFINEGERP
jgi:putative glutamine amidotransferase